jgi:hypothetical protein
VWLFCIAGVIGAFYSTWQIANIARELIQIEVSAGFILIIFGSSLFGTLLVTAVIMVLLDIASDISITKQSNLDILKKLNQQGAASGVKEE